MTSLPSLTKVDPNNYGQIGAMDAAKFLKKSHLSDVILSKIWDIADPNSRGFLDKAGMFVALKLCALAQQGHNLSLNNIYLDILPPKMGETIISNKISCCPLSTNPSISNSYWFISSAERVKYEQLFRNLEPINGLIPGNKVKGVLMDSNLPLEILGKIWDLADIDKDGKLDQHEFIIAMHLVYKALEKKAIPSAIPIDLLTRSNMSIIDSISKRQVSVTPVSQISSSNISSVLVTDVKTIEWVVSNEDQKNADKLFTQADKDMDGFVSGSEIKDIFIQSGLSQAVLAHIWALCDISQTGKLNNEQFALAMYLIKQKMNGIDLPNALNVEMIPPSLKKKVSEFVMENNNINSYSNSELDMINKDINQIIQEKLTMEQDISQKEADIKIKIGEIKSLQSELDTLAATLKQLDNQKGEAQKRLYDLKIQVDKLRQQAIDQETTLQFQEDELNNKRQEIECLKLAEYNLELQQQEHKNHLNYLCVQLQNIQLKISQTKANLSQLEEQQHQIVDAITQYDTAFTTGDASIVPDSSLLFKAKVEGKIYNLDAINDLENLKAGNINEKQLFNKEHINMKNSCNYSDIYHEDNLFETSFSMECEKKISLVDPCNVNKKESYDPFNDGIMQNTTASDMVEIKDPFGDDPFAALHAPMRTQSPSPALPPKKCKQPPPRPAPPRPVQGPCGIARVSGSPPIVSTITSIDPFDNLNSFDNTTTNCFEFADFAKFDEKPDSAAADSKKYILEDSVKMDLSYIKKLPDFVEDPFLDYRYEDLSMLDPFYDNIDNFDINVIDDIDVSKNLRIEKHIKLTTN